MATDTDPPPSPSPSAPLAAASAGVLRRRRPLPGSRALVGGLLVTVSVLLLFATGGRSSDAGRSPYLVAARRVPVGRALRPGDVRAVAMALPPDQAAHAFSSPAQVAGRVTLGPLQPGDLVTSGAVSADRAPSELARLSFAIDTDRAADGTLQAGDHIDVYATYGTGPTAVTSVVAAGVEVLTDPTSSGGSTLGGGAGRQVISVGLTRLDDALHLAHAHGPPSSPWSGSPASAVTPTPYTTTRLAGTSWGRRDNHHRRPRSPPPARPRRAAEAMGADRYVVLGLAHPRSAWFTEVARWATSGSLAIEFLKCLTIEELRVLLGSGRPFSALLIDAALPTFDRDLLALAGQADCPVMAVGEGVRPHAEREVATVLAAPFSREALLDQLAQHARPIRTALATAVPAEPSPPSWQGRLVAVTGTGGTGASTVAIALAQGLARQVRTGGEVLLADLALDADQAVLHGADDVVPGLQELVEAHRTTTLHSQALRPLTFAVPDRGYHLLLGLRRHQEWASLRTHSFGAALRSLRQAFHVVVADTDPDVEGERECGSIEVEERNLMARAVIAQADVLVVVGSSGVPGVHGILRATRRLVGLRERPGPAIVVVNRSPRSPQARAEINQAVADLAESPVAIVHLSARRGLDEVVAEGRPLPGSFVASPTAAVLEALDRTPVREQEPIADPPAVSAGSLGHWTPAAPGRLR